MNLQDLADTARCKECEGYWRWCGICKNNDEPENHGDRIEACPRCKDHPGIDPDVIEWNIWNVAADDRHFFKGETNTPFVVIQVDPT